MLRVVKSELYVMSHSVVFWLFVVLTTLFTIYTVSIGVNGHRPAERFYFTTGERDAELESAVEQVMGTTKNHLFYREDREEYQLSPAAHGRISALPEYKHLLEREDFLHCVEIYPNRYGLDEENVFEQWAATEIFADIGGAFIVSIFFAIFFFGRARSRRSYAADALYGVRRRDMMLGRMAVYLAVGAVMSVLQTTLAFAAYAPRTPELFGFAAMARGMTARLTCDLFFYGAMAAFPVVIKNPIAAFAASFGFVVLFISNRGIVQLPIYRTFHGTLDCIITGEGFASAYLPLLLWAVGAIAISCAVSVLYIRRAQLK